MAPTRWIAGLFAVLVATGTARAGQEGSLHANLQTGITGSGPTLGGLATVASDRLFLAAEVGHGFAPAGGSSTHARIGANLAFGRKEANQLRVQPMIGFRRYTAPRWFDLLQEPSWPSHEEFVSATISLEAVRWVSPGVGLCGRVTMGSASRYGVHSIPDVSLTAGVMF